MPEGTNLEILNGPFVVKVVLIVPLLELGYGEEVDGLLAFSGLGNGQRKNIDSVEHSAPARWVSRTPQGSPES